MGAERQKTILLVDDEAIIAMSEKTALEKYGYNVITALSGEEAVTAVETTPGIDLILMDINLGSGIDGTEAAAIILRRRDLPVVFLSSHMEPEVVEKTEKITSYGYVVKDSSITVLDASIKMAFKLFEAKISEMKKEEALRESEERYHAILEQAADAIFIHDESGRIIEVNRKACRNLGYSREELLSLSIADIDPEAIQTEKHKLWSEILAGKQELFESRHQRKDGSAIPVEVTLGSVRRPAGPAVIGIVRDISERKRTEEALRQSEERMRAIVEGTPHLFFYIQDAQANTTYVSPTIENITGYKAETWLQRKDWFITDAAVNQAAREITQAHLRGEFKNEAVLVEIRHANGHPILLEAYEYPITKNGKIAGLQGVAHDITQRKQAEQALRESEERFRTLYENSTLGLYRTTPDGRIQLANPALIRMLGYSSFAELANVDLQRSGFTPSHSRARFIENIEESSEVSGLEYAWKRKDGSSVLVRESARAIRDAQGKTLYYEGIVEDISARKQDEEELKKSEDKFRAIFNSASDGMFIVDLKTRKFLMCNAKCAKMLGYTQEEFSNLDITDIHLKEDLPFIIDQIGKFSRGEEGIRNDIKFKRKNGSILESDLSPALLTIAEDKCLLISFKDITERKQAEFQMKAALEALKVSEARAQALLRTIPDMLFRVNRQGVFLDYKADVKDLYVQSEPSIIGKRYRDILPPEFADLIDLKIRATLETGMLQTFEYGLPFPGQGKRDYEARMVASGTDEVTAIIRNISESNLAEKALRESEEKYRSILNTSPDGISITNMEGRIVMASPALVTMIGCEREKEMLGRLFSDFISPDDRERVASKVALMFQGTMMGLSEYHGLRADGSVVDLEVNGEFIRDTAGRPTQMVFIIRDITERKRAEEEKEQVISLQRATIESTADGILVINYSGKIMDFNQRFAQMWRVPDSVLETRDDAQLLRFVLDQLLDPQGFLAKVNELYAAPERESFDLLQFKDGRCFERYSRPQLISGRPVGRVWSFRDISARQQAEKLTEALYEISQAVYSTGALQELFEHIHHALSSIIPTNNFFIALLSDDGKALSFPYFIDEKDPEDSAAIYVDNAQSLTVEVFQTKRALLLDEPELRERYVSGRNLVWGTAPKCWLGVPLIMRETVIGVLAVQDYHKSGAYSHKDVALLESAAGQIGMAIDRKRAEEALRISEKKFHDIFENVLDAYYETTLDGTILEVSPSIEFVSKGQYRREQLIGKSMNDFYSDSGKRQTLLQALQESGKVMDYEILLKNRDGSSIPCSISSKIHFDQQGRPEKILGTIRDITERKQAEEEIKRQLSEKEILLREVHHRIKNNIASIGGLIALRMQSVSNPQAIAVLKDAVSRVNSMRILYDKLLLSETYMDVPVKNYVESLADSVIALFPDSSKIKIDKRIDDFLLDTKRLFPLGIIINEILTNIMKYAFSDRKSGMIKIALTNVSGRVTLAIQDNGKGLPAGFDINETKGFGLMLVKMLSQQLGGSFSIKKHKGTRCTIEFDI